LGEIAKTCARDFKNFIEADPGGPLSTTIRDDNVGARTRHGCPNGPQAVSHPAQGRGNEGIWTRKSRTRHSNGFAVDPASLTVGVANLPGEVADQQCNMYDNGIYYGYASVGADATTYPMVMSLGWNPFYKNIKRSAVRFLAQ
jgi:hypothetical protein